MRQQSRLRGRNSPVAKFVWTDPRPRPRPKFPNVLWVPCCERAGKDQHHARSIHVRPQPSTLVSRSAERDVPLVRNHRLYRHTEVTDVFERRRQRTRQSVRSEELVDARPRECGGRQHRPEREETRCDQKLPVLLRQRTSLAATSKRRIIRFRVLWELGICRPRILSAAVVCSSVDCCPKNGPFRDTVPESK
jgi:hypothetical protein